MERTVLSWSGGKDAAHALYAVRRETDLEVEELLTTVSAENDRSSLHGVRRSLLDRQATKLGLPVNYVELPAECSNREYEEIMSDVTERYEERGIERMAFGDVLLEDVRQYREERLSQGEMEGRWPLWGRDTADLATDFLAAGFAATVVCVDGERLDESFAGRELTETFLRDLPADVDPCGENGEFHTFVRDGPTFDEPIRIETGETVTRSVGGNAFHYCDVFER